MLGRGVVFAAVMVIVSAINSSRDGVLLGRRPESKLFAVQEEACFVPALVEPSANI